MLNKAILMGRLTRDPEMRYTQSNTPVTSFTLAIDRDRKGPNGERQTDFIDCVAWGKQAEFVKSWFAKGMMAIVVGRVQSRNWEDRNGNKRTSIEINANEVMFGESKKDKAAPKSEPAAPLFDLPVSDDDFTELDDMSGIPF